MTASPGNTNALKHGLYARRFSDAEKKHLRGINPQDLTFEIAALRVAADRILALIATAEKDEDKANYHNALTHAMIGIATLARTNSILTGTYTPLEDAKAQTLANVDFYLTDDAD
jgi:hypothetical protein